MTLLLPISHVFPVQSSAHAQDATPPTNVQVPPLEHVNGQTGASTTKHVREISHVIINYVVLESQSIARASFTSIYWKWAFVILKVV